MENFFNTEGPQQSDLHYTLPPLQRWDLVEVLSLIEQRKYFVLHAPRQTGKTTCMLALMDYLNEHGKYQALYVNIEPAQALRSKVEAAMPLIVDLIGSSADVYLQDRTLQALAKLMKGEYSAAGMLSEFLRRYAQQSAKPIVLFLDEVDALVGDTLIALLRQLRAGYNQRPHAFPISIILCGVRDVRDYRIHSTQEGVITGGSAFNIKAESLRLGYFDQDDVEILYAQHTEHTGQSFEAGCTEYIYQQSGGQPWLVNALGYQACYRSKGKRDRSLTITLADLAEAREELIESRAVHLDQLADKLKEPRVHRVIAEILASGEQQPDAIAADDQQYLADLGLITIKPRLAIANPIYREIIPRTLSWMQQTRLTYETEWYVNADGSLNMHKLLSDFQQFFRENSESWIQRFDYQEAGPQLLLQAFLQRVINGGGRIEREYGLGRSRTDLLVQWPLDREQGFHGSVQKIVIELKVQHKSLEATIAAGLEQTYEYNQRVGCQEAYLIIFNRDPSTTWEAKCFQRDEHYQGLKISVWGM